MSKPRLLITGSKGFVAQGFIKAYGNEFDIVEYDIQDGYDLLNCVLLERSMQGCDLVLHTAAIPAPREGRTFEEYFRQNVEATFNVAEAALSAGVKRLVFTSSTTIYGIEGGIPFNFPITESQPFVSQYLKADDLECRDIDLSYHISKVMAEQILAWYGLNKKMETAAIRIGPVGKVFLGTSVSLENAAQGIYKALVCKTPLWYEAFSIVDDIAHISTQKANVVLGYVPQNSNYAPEQIRSTIAARKSS
ncbi:MAG: NAD-dependent epimerase/dehydratase family protein [Bdellovibrionales bacterium]